MKTFIAWLIANIETIFITLIIIFILKEILSDPSYWQGDSTTGGTIVGTILYTSIIFASIAPKKLSHCGMCMLVYAVVYLYLYMKITALFFPFLIPSILFAVFIAVFTYINMYEVVSRRMLYVNSNADIFEYRLLYTINRFVAAFCGMTAILVVANFFDHIKGILMNQ